MSSTFDSKTTIPEYIPVSLKNEGLNIGGGTSIYENLISNLNTYMNCPKYLTINSFYENTYLVSYVENDTTSKLLLIGVDPNTPEKAYIIHVFDLLNYKIYKHVVLNPSAGTFVIITEDYDPQKTDSLVIGASISSSSDYQLTLGSPMVYSSSNFSITPDLSRLDDDSYAIVYYGNDTVYDNSSVVLARVGIYRHTKINIYWLDFFLFFLFFLSILFYFNIFFFLH